MSCTNSIAVSDMPKEDILHHLNACTDFIASALSLGKSILVHWCVVICVQKSLITNLIFFFLLATAVTLVLVAAPPRLLLM